MQQVKIEFKQIQNIVQKFDTNESSDLYGILAILL